MYKTFLRSLFIFISVSVHAGNSHRGKDSLHIYKKIDTTFIENCRDLLTVKLIGVVRTNKFSIKDNVSQNTLEYSINTNANMGLGLSYKGVGVEFQYNPPGLNKDDAKYGKSTQIAFATSAKSRLFNYDIYYRYNQGYHTTTTYKIPGDTSGTLEHIYRADIKNTLLGFDVVYVFNNKRFSSSAPYSLTQRQIKSAGSMLLGTFASLYAINADSVIFPDSLKKNFSEEAQFKDAGSFIYGISCGYTYTFIFFRNWFINLYTLPGLSVQQYFSVNAFNEETRTKYAIGASLKSRFSIGYNRRNYFIGLSLAGDNYAVNNDKTSSLSYKFGGFRFYYGHRFDLRKLSKKHSSTRPEINSEIKN